MERKNFNRFDYADRDIALSLASSSISGDRIKPSSFTAVDVDDVITQTQYVTIYQFNQLLRKLDLDNGMNSYSFLENIALAQGDNLSSRVESLVIQLNITDPSTFTDSEGNSAYVFSGATEFEALQTDFNNLVTRLNESEVPFFNNYIKSTRFTLHEAIVIENRYICVIEQTNIE